MSDIKLGDTIFRSFTSRAFASGIPTVLAGTPVMSIDEDDGGTPITAGITLTVSHNSVVGKNMVKIIVTGGNGFESGKDYNIYISTGTVAGVSVVGEVVGHFSIERSAAAQDLANGTDGLGAIKSETALIKTETDKIALVTAGAGVAGSLIEQTLNIDQAAMRGTDSALLAANVNVSAGIVESNLKQINDDTSDATDLGAAVDNDDNRINANLHEYKGDAKTEIEAKRFIAGVFFDGVTNATTTYPAGERNDPVTLLANARIIANTNNVKKITVNTSPITTETVDLTDYELVSEGGGGNSQSVITFDGRNKTLFKTRIIGFFITASASPPDFDACSIERSVLNAVGFSGMASGVVNSSVIRSGTYVLTTTALNGGSQFNDCTCENITIDPAGATSGDIVFDNCTGKVTILSGATASTRKITFSNFKGTIVNTDSKTFAVEINDLNGVATISASNTAGSTVFIGGKGKITDSSGGGHTVSGTDSFVEDPDIEATLVDTSNMQPKLGAITGSGDNTVLGYFKANLNKAAATPSDIGGTFAPADDSNEAIRDRGDSNWSSAAMNPAVLEETTIAVLTDQKNFTLTAGSTDNDAYNGCVVVIEDASTAVQKAVGVVLDYVGATKAIVLKDDPGVFVMAGTDKIAILADRSLKPSVDNRTVDIDSSGFVERVVLNDTTTTNTDMRGTDGVDTAPMRGTDSAALATVATEARLAELDAGNLPTDIANVKSDTASTLTGVNQKKFPNGAVYCDGTTQATTAYPAGELITPSDDITDALTISNTNNIDKIISSVDVIVETLNLTDKTLESGAGPGVGSRGTFGSGNKTLLRTTLRGWQMTTAGANGVSELSNYTDCTVFPGTGIEDSTNDLFERCNFQGTGTINSGYSGKTSGSRFVRSHFEDLTLDMKDYAIGSTTIKDSTGILTVVDSGAVGATKVIEIDNFSGNITNTNTKSFVVKIRGGGGILTIDVANNAGSTVIEGGDWKVVDNSAGGHTVTHQKPNGIDTIQTATDKLAFTGGNVHSHTKVQDDLALTAQQKLDVNAEVLDVSNVDTIPELAAATLLPKNPTERQAKMALYMALRNESNTTNTLFKIKNDAGAGVADQTLADDGTTLTRSKVVAGT